MRSFGVAILLGAFVLTLAAKEASALQQTTANPPEQLVLRGAEAYSAQAAQARLRGAPARSIGDNEALTTLNITYAYNRIFNPTTNRYDVVRLRSYNGVLTTPPGLTDEAWSAAPNPVGPTIRLKPAETVRATIDNKLPADSCVEPQGTHNIPNCFGVTNLHAHGLHVSPTGNSDNVLISIRPGETFQYEYNIPADHPAGTFWYHSHRHGSTALQVSSGMVGALIVAGERLPKREGDKGFQPGDIDTLLITPGQGNAHPRFPERILLFEQIQYGCRDGQSQIVWTCPPYVPNDPTTVGGVEGYDQFGPGTWVQSGRYTLVNGQLQPVLSLPAYGRPESSGPFNAKVGQPERWRLIHGGVRDTIKLSIYKAVRPSGEFAKLQSNEERQKWTADNCVGRVVNQWEFATDGLTRPQIARLGAFTAAGKTTVIPNVLQPAYRSDALVVFPEAGDYCLIDEAAPANDTVNQQSKDRKLLAIVTAEGSGGVADDKAGITNALVAAANVTLSDAALRKQIVDELKADLKLSLYVPHKTIEEGEVEGRQSLTFSIDATSPAPSSPQVRFGVNHLAYEPDRVDHVLKLESADEWFMTSTLANHPFHIHVNPFQIVKILKQVTTTGADGKTSTEWKDLTDPTIDYATRLQWETVGNNPPDPEYLDLKGVWKDTLLVKQGYQIYIRSRYERYIGDFVLHCHILDHEDQGMMQNIRVSLSGDGERHGNH